MWVETREPKLQTTYTQVLEGNLFSNTLINVIPMLMRTLCPCCVTSNQLPSLTFSSLVPDCRRYSATAHILIGFNETDRSSQLSAEF